MNFSARDFSNLLGMKGFSDNLLNNHFTLYQGYVANTKKLAETLLSLQKEAKTATPEFAELQRRFGWEFNGMRLHEYYFENLIKGGNQTGKDDFEKLISGYFESFDNWQQNFKAIAMMRGIGWVILYRDKISGGFFNCWVNEHDLGHLAGADPILVLDVFEHAFMVDYGLKRADYIAAFFENINWETVIKRAVK